MPDSDLQRILEDLRRRREQLAKLRINFGQSEEQSSPELQPESRVEPTSSTTEE